MKSAFAFTKLVVDDLPASANFYEEVAGLVRQKEVSSHLNGCEMTEYIYQPDTVGGAAFVLLSFHGRPAPDPGESITGLMTADVNAFVQKAVACGASVLEPPNDRPTSSVRIAIIADPEGHWIEVIQPIPSS